MANPKVSIANLLDKMTSNDKDFRFMATNDLISELQKDSINLDDDSERKVVRMVLKLLEDKNGEVQNLAVKCLGPLVRKVKEAQVESMVEHLVTNMLSSNEQLRDICSIGLKTVIVELPPNLTQLASNVCRRVAPKLVSAIADGQDVSVALEALDILTDLLGRFGSLLAAYHASIQQALLPQLASARLAVRKRAIVALGFLVASAAQSLFIELMEFLLSELNKNSNPSTTRTYIQCISTVCRQVGHKLGPFVTQFLPLLFEFLTVDDDELREHCLAALEALVRRCLDQMAPYIDAVVQRCLEFIKYDPNYNYDSDDDMAGDDDQDQAASEGGDAEDYSDDDDLSWKVRRAAARCLEAVIVTRRDLLAEFYRCVAPAIVARFKEREQNVKADILAVYVALLRQTRTLPNAEPDAMEVEESPVALLKSQRGELVRACAKLLTDKNPRTRQEALRVLTELLHVLPAALGEQLQPLLLPKLLHCISEKQMPSNVKIDALQLLQALIDGHAPAILRPCLAATGPVLVLAVDDSFYKVVSEALYVVQKLVVNLRPTGERTVFAEDERCVRTLFGSVLGRLRVADIDQEVKERAIAAMGAILAHFGDRLADELPGTVSLLLERLKNEVTRLAAVRALTLMAQSPLALPLGPVLEQAVPILASFLRKNHRALRLSSLNCLHALVLQYGGSLSGEHQLEVVRELAPLLNESDLHIAQLAVQLLTSLTRLQRRTTLFRASPELLSSVLSLARSPLLQGTSLRAMRELFVSMAESGDPDLAAPALVQRLLLPIYEPSSEMRQLPGSLAVHKQAFHSVAQIVAALVLTDQTASGSFVSKFLQDLAAADSTDSVRLVSLLVLGYVGKQLDLSGFDVWSQVLRALDLESEDVKSAASFALGCVAVGDLPMYLPHLLREIQSEKKRQYLLLHALKEVINCESTRKGGIETLKPHLSTIWQLLFSHCDCPEEGARNVVAECLGKLCLLEPEVLLSQLQKALSHASPLFRSVAVTAIKFTVVDHPHGIDTLLKSCLGDFLAALTDADLHVRHVALLTFNSAVHNKPSLVKERLDTLLPALYVETRVKAELIREVSMGPFKHTIDDGLDVRKAAFECMYTLLDACLDRVNVFEFLSHVEEGLKDHYDIKMLTFLMLARLATLVPGQVLQKLDSLVDALRQTVNQKVKSNAVKQEYEKMDELRRAAFRALNALLQIADADKNPVMSEFLNQIRNNKELKTLFESVRRDSSEFKMDTN